MKLEAREIRQMILVAMAVLVIPMVMFPAKLGLELAQFSVLRTVLEVVFYGLAIYFINRKAPVQKIIGAAFLSLGIRAVLGALFGALIILMYQIKAEVAFSFGLVSYMPSIILHIVSIPLMLYPFIKKFKVSDEKLQPEQPKTEAPKRNEPVMKKQTFDQPVKKDISSSSFVITRDKKGVSLDLSVKQAPVSEKKFDTEQKDTTSVNGFDKVVNYIGENGGVHLAAVVDKNGLLLGGFKRTESSAEDLAPMALLLLEQNNTALKKMNLPNPEKLEVMFEDKRLIVAYEQTYCLMVISERSVDDLIHIRINQGLEMLKNYVAERYSEQLSGNAERIYV